MLVSTSRPMPAETATRSGPVAAIGGSSPARKGSKTPQRRRHRRLASPAAVGARFSTSAATTAVRASSSSSSDAAPAPHPPSNNTRKRVVILGGTGRVGASTAAQLAKGPGGEQLDLVLVGKPGGGGAGGSKTPSSSFASASAAVSAACKKYPALSKAIVAVASVDSGDVEKLTNLFKGASCVIHCAGPFQSGGAGARMSDKNNSSSVPAPLAAAIRARVPYVDVCDDPDWAKVRRARSLFLVSEREREREKEKTKE